MAASQKTESNEQIVQNLLNSYRQLIFVIDAAGTLLAVNNRFAGQFGYEPMEMLGRRVYDLLPEKVAERRQTFVEHVIRTGQPGRIENPQHGKSFDTIAYPIRDEAGQISRVLVWVDDITEPKKAEKKLVADLDGRKVLFEQSPDGMLIIDTQTERFLDLNAAVHAQSGYSREEFAALGVSDVEAKKTAEEEQTPMASEAKSGSGDFETLHSTKQGEIRNIRTTGQVIKTRGDLVYHRIPRGITDSRPGKEAVRKAEEKYRGLFLNATEGMFQATPEGRFIIANPSLAHILGYDSPEELMARVTDIGKQMVVDPNARSDYFRTLDETGMIKDFECQLRKPDGTVIWAAINARAICDRQGKVVYYEGTFQDITQRKLARQQLITQRDVALRLAQMTDYEEVLLLILQTALDSCGMESGGIWLKEERTEDFQLISSMGLSNDFVGKVRRIGRNSSIWSLMMQGSPVYIATDRKKTPVSYREGFKYRAIVPILRKNQLIGSFNILSRYREDITEEGQMSLAFLSAESGAVIARMQTKQLLEKEVQTRREAEKALEAERIALRETNTALRVLLKHGEENRREIEQKVVANLKQFVLPHVEKLKKSTLGTPSEMRVGLIEANLKEIFSPFLNNVQSFNLTPRQIEIVALIKAARTTKDIAEFLHISKAAVDRHRFLIRQKLNLNNKKANLRSYLLSLAE